ncbi:MAG: hypothetical protein ACK583_09640 [Cyanobacteriota bacterium]
MSQSARAGLGARAPAASNPPAIAAKTGRVLNLDSMVLEGLE